MESQLFDWENWDIMDTMDFIFYNCTLKQDIGKYKTGEKFESININYSNGELTINEEKFKLKLVIL